MGVQEELIAQFRVYMGDNTKDQIQRPLHSSFDSLRSLRGRSG